MIEKNTKGVIEFPEVFWNGVSKEAKELVEQMTQRYQEKRITSKMCLENPWFLKGASNKTVLVSAIDNMKKYCDE